MSTKNEYNKMNWLYSVLYGNMSLEEIKNLYFISDHKELLSSYNMKTTKIIDCACGNGIQATALTLNGYNVTATDISSEMIELTNNLLEKYNIQINTDIKSWDELPSLYKNTFDIVFCTGNSIVHSKNAFERENNLNSLKELLLENGTVVIETRNWDKMILENKPFTAYNKLFYKDKEYIPLYHWDLKGMEEEAKVEIIIQEITKDNNIKLYESELTFTPFSHKSLLDILKKLGLNIVKDTFEENEDWYFIYARYFES